MPNDSPAYLVHYHAPHTRSATIRWLFEELGVEHRLEVLDLKKGAHKAADYLAVNPMGKVPAIVHRGTVVTETPAIAMYLADAFPAAGLAPPVGDPARGTYLRWMVFNVACVEPAILDRALKREGGPSGMLPYGDSETTIRVLASALRPGPYILGETFSAADVVIGSSVRWMLGFKLLPELPEFTRYAELLGHRPALQRAQASDQALLQKLGG
ncbi:MAG: glutathione S-transferase family protein [Hyphomicrobium sp.]